MIIVTRELQFIISINSAAVFHICSRQKLFLKNFQNSHEKCTLEFFLKKNSFAGFFSRWLLLLQEH